MNYLRLGTLFLLLVVTGIAYGSLISTRGGHSDDFCLQNDARINTYSSRVVNWLNDRYAHAVSVPPFYDLVDGAGPSEAPWWRLAAIGVFFHIVAVALFYLLLSSVGLPAAPVFAGTTFFALFPLKNEAVLWAGGWLAYLPPAVVALAAALVYTKVLRTRRTWHPGETAIVVAATAFALLSVEFFAIILGCVLLARLTIYRNLGAHRKDVLVIVLLLLGTIGVFAASHSRIEKATVSTNEGYYSATAKYHSAIESGVKKRLVRVFLTPFMLPTQTATMSSAGIAGGLSAFFLSLAAGILTWRHDRAQDNKAPPLCMKTLLWLSILSTLCIGAMFSLLYSVKNGFPSRVLYLPTLLSGATIALLLTALLQAIRGVRVRQLVTASIIGITALYGGGYAMLAIEDQTDYAKAWDFQKSVLLDVAAAVQAGASHIVIENTDRKIGHIKAPIFADDWSLGCALRSELSSPDLPKIYLRNEAIQMTAPLDAAVVTLPLIGQPR
jgi:hypothetical protein